ncbi:MAG: hypothetical protein AB7D33_09505, partial [Sphingobium sp.]
MKARLLADPAIAAEEPFGPTPGIAPLIRIAGLVVLGFGLIFVLWGLVAPLSKAAVAPGVVQVEGRRRTVQHLEGGIVSEI